MRYTSLRKIMVSAQVQAKREIKAEFRTVADTVRGVLLRAAGGDGDNPVPYTARDDSSERRVRQVATAAIDRMFLGADGLPFASDGVTALAPYPLTLNTQIANVTAQIVRGHYKWMEARVPEDVWNWLSTVPSRPVPIREMRKAGRVVSEQDNPFLRQEGESVEDHIERLRVLRIFSPNPLAEYEPAHTWVDPKGYRLSDRIWNTAAETRRKLDEILRDGIREGKSARQIANLVEQFLIPDRAALRTRKPYGTDASYDAMRLARTEIARAANQAAYISGYNNPYVETYDIARSPNGDPKCSICPQHATIGINQERVRDPYVVGDGTNGPFHPHCMCRYQANVSGDVSGITDRLRAMMQTAREENLKPYMTPAQADAFIAQLIGPQMVSLVIQAA